MTMFRFRLVSLAASCAFGVAGFAWSAADADAAPASAACGNGSLAVSSTSTQGATGHGSFALLFRNVGASTCSMTGYSGVDALGGSGQLLAHAQRTLSGFMGGAGSVGTVIVAPGDTASATVEWLNFNPVTTGDCTFSTSVAATPPNTTSTVHLPVSVSICQLQVHPTVAGASGQGTPSGVPAGSGGLAATHSSAIEQRRIVLAIVGGGLILLAAAGMLRPRRSARTPT